MTEDSKFKNSHDRRLISLRDRMLPWQFSRILGMMAFMWFVLVPMSAHSLAVWVAVLLAMVLIGVYKFDYLNPFVLFSTSWLVILFFSAQDISDYSREVNKSTIYVVGSGLLVALLLIPPAAFVRSGQSPLFVNERAYNWCRSIFVALTVINVAAAGYIPLVSLIVDGESNYMEFGVKGFYGFFNAFANSFGVLAFYLWLNTRSKKYLVDLFICTFVFILFVSRQNFISLFFECFVVYCFLFGRPAAAKTLSLVVSIAILFSIAGNARVTQDISDLAQIKSEYLWIPTPVVWIYSYSYFNILNLDNLVSSQIAPKFDASSLHQLIPSFLRPDASDALSTLEAPQFNVQSYIYPLYQDFGTTGVIIFIGIFCIAIERCRKKSQTTNRFYYISSYSVLLFCFLFSFFVNFWFYLPIIFQILFFFIYSKSIIFTYPKRSRTSKHYANSRRTSFTLNAGENTVHDA